MCRLALHQAAGSGGHTCRRNHVQRALTARDGRVEHRRHAWHHEQVHSTASRLFNHQPHVLACHGDLERWRGHVARFNPCRASRQELTRIEVLRVEPDSPAVVVIDEASGTIVMGANVRVSTVAIAQGGLTVRVTETAEVSQPGALSNGTTVATPKTNVQVDDSNDRRLGILQSNVTLRDLVASLNALGVGPRDMISILQSIKAAGALQAELQVQ